MKTAKWTFNINSESDFLVFSVSLIDFWLGRGGNPAARTAVNNIARDSRPGRKLLEQSLPYIKRNIYHGDPSLTPKDRKCLADLYNEIEHLCRTRKVHKVYVSLPNRGSFRATTRTPLREVGAPSDFDRRHVIADFFSKHFIESILNALPDGDTQCDYLHEVGCDPDNFAGSIQQAARKWQLNVFNHLDNLFMGPAWENRMLGSMRVAVDQAPWQSSLYSIIRRDLSDILGTNFGSDANICRDIEQQAMTALMKATI